MSSDRRCGDYEMLMLRRVRVLQAGAWRVGSWGLGGRRS